jgi:hypothetical protein
MAVSIANHGLHCEKQSLEAVAKSDGISSRPDNLVCRTHPSPFTRHLSSKRTHDFTKADDDSSFWDTLQACGDHFQRHPHLLVRHLVELFEVLADQAIHLNEAHVAAERTCLIRQEELLQSMIDRSQVLVELLADSSSCHVPPSPCHAKRRGHRVDEKRCCRVLKGCANGCHNKTATGAQ